MVRFCDMEAHAGSNKAEKNTKPDDEKAHAGSKQKMKNEGREEEEEDGDTAGK